LQKDKACADSEHNVSSTDSEQSECGVKMNQNPWKMLQSIIYRAWSRPNEPNYRCKSTLWFKWNVLCVTAVICNTVAWMLDIDTDFHFEKLATDEGICLNASSLICFSWTTTSLIESQCPSSTNWYNAKVRFDTRGLLANGLKGGKKNWTAAIYCIVAHLKKNHKSWAQSQKKLP